MDSEMQSYKKIPWEFLFHLPGREEDRFKPRKRALGKTRLQYSTRNSGAGLGTRSAPSCQRTRPFNPFISRHLNTVHPLEGDLCSTEASSSRWRELSHQKPAFHHGAVAVVTVEMGLGRSHRFHLFLLTHVLQRGAAA